MGNSASSGNILGYASGTQPGLVSTVAQTFAGAKTFSNGLVFAASSLSDAQATILGLKQYLHGTTYNGGNAPTVTTDKSGTSVDRGIFIPYQCQDGTWRVRFNINVSWTSATLTGAVITINGITTISVTQQISGSYKNATSIVPRPIFNASASTIALDSSSAGGVTGAYLSGDVELNAKPTWAY